MPRDHTRAALFLQPLFIYAALAFDISLPLATLAAQTWLLVGVIELTRQDPRLTLAEGGLNVRLLVRAAAALALCLAPVSGGILSPSGGSAFPLELLRVAYTLVLLLTVAGVTIYMSGLALRIPEKRLADTSRSVGFGLGVTAIVYLLGRHLLPAGSVAQGFDRSFSLGMLALLTNLFGFAVLCCLFRTVFLWWSYRRILSNHASRA